jgi:hypothetical protein
MHRLVSHAALVPVFTVPILTVPILTVPVLTVPVLTMPVLTMPVLIGALAAQANPAAPAEPALVASLTPENLAAWRDHIRATGDEQAWAGLPWLMTLHDGLQAAAAANKPLLLWTMNGHPFGCT